MNEGAKKLSKLFSDNSKSLLDEEVKGNQFPTDVENHSLKFELRFRSLSSAIKVIIDDYINQLFTNYGLFKTTGFTKNDKKIIIFLKKNVLAYLFFRIESDPVLKRTIKSIEIRDIKLKETITSIGNVYPKNSEDKKKLVEELNINFLNLNIERVKPILEPLLSFIEIFALLFIKNEKNKKNHILSMQIAKPYVPKGKKITSHDFSILLIIQIKRKELEKIYGKNKRGKSDLRTATYITLHELSEAGVIGKYEFKPEKIYQRIKKTKGDVIKYYLKNR